MEGGVEEVGDGLLEGLQVLVCMVEVWEVKGDNEENISVGLVNLETG